MIKIKVEHILDKSPGEVFDRLTDHENYKHFSVFQDSTLLEAGVEEKMVKAP